MPEILIMKRNLARPTPTCLLVLLKSWRKLPAHMDSATAHMDSATAHMDSATADMDSATAHMDGAIALELTFIVWTVDKKIRFEPPDLMEVDEKVGLKYFVRPTNLFWRRSLGHHPHGTSSL